MMSKKVLTTQKGSVNRALVHLNLQKLGRRCLALLKFFKKCLHTGKRFLLCGIFPVLFKTSSCKHKCSRTSLTSLCLSLSNMPNSFAWLWSLLDKQNRYHQIQFIQAKNSYNQTIESATRGVLLIKKAVLINFAKFRGKPQCQSLFF